MILINLLLIASIIVFIIDNTDIIDSIKKFLHKRYIKKGDYHNLQLKPFQCSLCMTFWCSLIYLIVIQHFTLHYIAFGCLLAYLTPQIKDIENWLADTLQTIINLLYKLITR